MRYLALLTIAGTLAAGDARYARLGESEGAVEVQLRAGQPWVAAARNLPLIESAWLRTGAASRLEVEFDEGSAWRLGAQTRAAIADYTRLSTGQRITTLSLDEGVAWFTGRPEGADSIVLSVPGAQVTVTRAARIRLDVGPQTASIAVLSGWVRFSSPAADMDLHEGQTTRVEAANPSRFFLFKEVAAEELDEWSAHRDEVLAGSISAGHTAHRYGRADLDTAGEWVETGDLGSVWKPRVTEGWAPFRAGRWQWYDTLGYTWVSSEPWGWLPYHYGRWALTKSSGWVWVPGSGAIFKPGEVYWRRGENVAGWGPLAPGELYPSPDPDHPQPQQFLNANTTWAEFSPDADSIDPTGFKEAPKDPLAESTLVPALPSPAFIASRLDAFRPPLEAGRVRIVPVLDSVTLETEPVRIVPPPPPQPIVIVTQAAPPPQDPVMVAVPYAVPIGIPVQARPAAKPSKPPVNPSKPAAAAAPAPNRRVPSARDVSTIGRRPSTRRNPSESELRTTVASAIGERDFEGALTALEVWAERFPGTSLADVRQLCYMQAYDGLNRSEEVISAGTPLLDHNLPQTLPDTAQIVGVFSLLVTHVGRLPAPAKDQVRTGVRAATGLLSIVPVYFTEKNRPGTISSGDWNRARSGLEQLARQTLAALQKRSAALR